ncbi:MAG TPA: hypothetical protein VJ813_15825 [Vicinamibacterales bacterium]|nr:hypothetical protein [Vicinamibacterales bacterium]
MPRLLVPLMVLLTAAPAAAQMDGAFTLRQNDRDDRVNLNLQYADGRSNWGRNVERAAFSDINRSGDRITFALRRAAGTFTFEGKGSMERASGWYEFAPSSEFRREIERLGFRDVDDKALFVIAFDDLTIPGVKTLQGLVSDTLDTAQLVRLINHGAGLRHIQSMTDSGFKKLSSDEYRRARDHGVTAEFAREMADLGMKLPLDQLIRSRDHGVTADYVRAMRSAGHEAGHDELVRARDHGVTADYVKRMSALGFDGLSLAEYVRMRDHGVTPDYVEAMRDAGLAKLSAGEIVRLRDHGISASYVRRTKELFKETPSVDQIIRLRTRGDIDR